MGICGFGRSGRSSSPTWFKGWALVWREWGRPYSLLPSLMVKLFLLPTGEPPMKFSEHKAKLASAYLDSPQRSQLCAMALTEIELGLVRLASLGHPYHLVEGPDAPPEEFPKILYHADAGWRECLCQADVDDLGPGWCDNPHDAQLDKARDYVTAVKSGKAPRGALLPPAEPGSAPFDPKPELIAKFQAEKTPTEQPLVDDATEE